VGHHAVWCIEDPYNPTDNIARVVTQRIGMFHFVIQLFHLWQFIPLLTYLKSSPLIC
jgi:hypothetical protein